MYVVPDQFYLRYEAYTMLPPRPYPKRAAEILCIMYDAPEPNIRPPYTPSSFTSMVVQMSSRL